MGIIRSDPSPVGFFQELYAIVVGLGLALAIEQVIDLTSAGVPVRFEHLPLFLAYLNIAFALAHSSVRYLQLAYMDGALGSFGRGRVIGDLVLGVGQFLWLMALSFLITRPSAFAWGVMVLLVGRPIRDAVLMLGGRARLEFDKTVAAVHLTTIAVVGVSLLAAEIAQGSNGLWAVRIGGLVASLVFGLGLYVLAFRFFFPNFDRKLETT